MLIDTHAHLYWDSFKDDLDEVIQRAIVSGVTTIINVGVDVQLSKKATELESDKIKFYSTIGIHPHEAIRYLDSVSIHHDIVKLEQLYRSNPSKIVAVGECGLDYKETDEKTKDLQKRLFQIQINLAKKLNLPMIVHCREAWEDTLDIIGKYPAILHCYSGLSPTTKRVLQTTNLIVSFAATLTYPKNEYLRDAAKLLPLEKIVLETDCPFLPPQSKRGQRNEPANILETAQLIADLKGLSLEEVATQTTKNASEILRTRESAGLSPAQDDLIGNLLSRPEKRKLKGKSCVFY